MNILGCSAFYHDSAAAICKDGLILGAVQEERFSRVKHDERFPQNAIRYCLSLIDKTELDAVAFYSNPFIKLNRFLTNAASLGKDSDVLIERSYHALFENELKIDKFLRDFIGDLGKHDKLIAVEHHMSHAASAFYPSPFDEACILTIDGVGEWATTTIGYGKENKIKLVKEINYPHSLGLLYTAFTVFCGFKANSGEYKLMGLAPYGEPIYYKTIMDNLVNLNSDGSFTLNMDYFNYDRSNSMTTEAFDKLMGGSKRLPESIITKREMDIAASIQKVCEEMVIALAKAAVRETSCKRICLAGGVALNCVANGKLMNENIIEDIWIQPAAGDAGGALGAALFASHQVFGIERKVYTRGIQKGSYLGPSYQSEEIRTYLDQNGFKYHEYDNKPELFKDIALKLNEQKVIGFFSGRMEFGPRSLGARSIIADPRSKEMQSKLNLKIKYRESFRPFAPSVLREKADEYFELNGKESPYMLLVADVVKDRQKGFNLNDYTTQNADIDMLKIVNIERSDIPAVTHVDFSARVQTVTAEDHPDYYALIKEFEKITGYAVIVNTSFNVRGEPIVNTPHDACKCFMRTEMDILVLENFMLIKDEQPDLIKEQFLEEGWQDEYTLD